MCRTLDTHPALRYCLLLDDMRIAGGKPDYRGDNILISWRTKETYGPVDAIETENGQLATEREALCARIDELCAEVERLREEVKVAGMVAYVQDMKGLKAENAKLREERDHWHVEQVHAFGNWEDAHKRATEIEAENAKLRELAGKMGEALGIGRGWCLEDCERAMGCLCEDECPIELSMRELGLEEHE